MESVTIPGATSNNIKKKTQNDEMNTRTRARRQPPHLPAYMTAFDNNYLQAPVRIIKNKYKYL